MTVRFSFQLHFDVGDVGHRCRSGYATLDIGDVNIHVRATAEIDIVMTHLAELKTEMLAAAVAEARWCSAFTGPDSELDVTLYCDRLAGHDGSHHAPGPDEGSEVAWGGEPPQMSREGAVSASAQRPGRPSPLEPAADGGDAPAMAVTGASPANSQVPVSYIALTMPDLRGNPDPADETASAGAR